MGKEFFMHIWVDADACPRVIRDILFRAAKRVKVTITLVANRPLRLPASQYIKSILVPSGLDVADEQILQLVQSGDLVITADIPFAAAVIDKGAVVLTPRGKVYTTDNIGEQLSIRNFMDELRGSGVETGGPSRLNNKDREIFANELHKFLPND